MAGLVSPMIPVHKVHDVSIRLRIVFATNHDAKGFDKGGKDKFSLTSQQFHIDGPSKSIDDFVGELGDVMSSIGMRDACRCGVCRFYVVFGQSPVALGPQERRRLFIAASWLSAREEDVDCGGVSRICDRRAGLCRKARWGNLLRLFRCHRPK